MGRLTLFLMMGDPGAGKTTVAQIIHEITGAEHLWADHERRQMFQKPSHSHQENLQLYEYLNGVANDLLRQGKSVIFDTNFSLYKDREHLRQIAAKHGAQTVLIWLRTPVEIAKQRATSTVRNNYEEIMPVSDFERMATNLEPARPEEQAIEVDGTKVTPQYIRSLLSDKL